MKIRHKYTTVNTARVRPASLGVNTKIDDGYIHFTVDRAIDAMLEINGNKWQALHLLVNGINVHEPHCDGTGLWYFGPGINNGRAWENVVDGQLIVPSDTTIYLASGAFLTAQVIFSSVKNSSVRGLGYISRPGKRVCGFGIWKTEGTRRRSYPDRAIEEYSSGRSDVSLLLWFQSSYCRR